MLSIQTEDETTIAVVSGRALPGSLSGTGTRRAIILGPASGVTMATIRFSSIPAQPPAVTVVGAAANQSGAYAPIQPASVQLQVSEASS